MNLLRRVEYRRTDVVEFFRFSSQNICAYRTRRGPREIYVGNGLSLTRAYGASVCRWHHCLKKTIVSNFGNHREKSKVTPIKFPTPYSWPRFEVTMTHTQRCVCGERSIT